MRSPSVSVVVPALNEERNIPHVFERIPKDVHQVVLVDGHSVDDTVAVARKLRPDVCVVSQTRKGKGNALACGFEAATGDVIAMVDADGSADPAEIPRFVAALVDGADFAKGSRFLPDGGSADITRLRAHGNQVLTTFFNLCYRCRYLTLLRLRRVLASAPAGPWPRCCVSVQGGRHPLVGGRVRDRDAYPRARR